MSKRAHMLATAAFVVATMPAEVEAQATTAFDGQYGGVSAAFGGAMAGSGRSCPKFAAPAPLTIAGGHAQAKWGEDTLQGNVTPQGALTMHISSGGGRFDGQINAQGVLSGTYTGFCAYNLVRQRRR